MPIIGWAYLSFICGLLSWYTGYGWLPLVGLMICGIALVAYANVESFAVSIVFLAGLLIAMGGPTPVRGFASHAKDESAKTFFDKKRDEAGKRIESIFGENAPMAKALLIADQSEIPRDVKQKYSRSGLIHMLSISGLHVSIIAGSVSLLLHIMRLSSRLAAAISLSVLTLYICVLGFPPPAVRAGVMVGVMLAANLLQRPTSRWAALALGGFIPLIHPPTVLNLGYQLSVGGIAGLVAASSVMRRAFNDKLDGWRKFIVKSLVASTLSTLVTAPLVGWTFGQISLIGPVANIFADPVISIVQPMLFLALVLAPITPVAQFIADSTHLPLKLFDSIAAFFANLPYAAIMIRPSFTTAVMSSIGVAAMIIAACSKRWTGRAGLVAVGAVAGIVWF